MLLKKMILLGLCCFLFLISMQLVSAGPVEGYWSFVKKINNLEVEINCSDPARGGEKLVYTADWLWEFGSDRVKYSLSASRDSGTTDVWHYIYDGSKAVVYMAKGPFENIDHYTIKPKISLYSGIPTPDRFFLKTDVVKYEYFWDILTRDDTKITILGESSQEPIVIAVYKTSPEDFPESISTCFFRLKLSPQMGYVPVRIEEGILDADNKVVWTLVIIRNENFAQVEPSIYLPTKTERELFDIKIPKTRIFEKPLLEPTVAPDSIEQYSLKYKSINTPLTDNTFSVKFRKGIPVKSFIP